MNCTKIVCFDLEMCCWNSKSSSSTGEIIEIGLAEIDLSEKKITKRAQYYVMPWQDEISEYCTKLTGISPQIVKKQGRSLDQVLKTVVKNFGGRGKLYAAWGRDDLVLSNECHRKSIEFPLYECLNMATLYKIKHGVFKERLGQKEALNRLQIEWEGRQHSAYVDAYNLAKLTLSVLS